MPTVRVLVVTDDDGGFNQWTLQNAVDARDPLKSWAFHLGEFVKVLTTTSWVGFTLELVRAHRNSPAGSGADVTNFKFDTSHVVAGQTRTIADYDMILFFPIEYGDPDAAFTSEVEAIATFMESGKGFFATGDHASLGSRIAGLLPRVRSMRRWWYGSPPPGAKQAPPPLGPDRHDTTQAGDDHVVQFEDQSEQIAQPIKPAMYSAGFTVRDGYPATRSLPHMLLCSPSGVVKVLPDHMHEGWVEVPDDLTKTFTIGGATHREYPDYGGAPLAPEVVATGHVPPGQTSPAILPVQFHTGGTDPTHEKTFGVIGAWDGHRVGKGRVVVDSTWHHFFDINLTGDRFLETIATTPAQEQKKHGFYVGGAPVADYQMIQHYFRNIVYWLIPAKRHAEVWWSAIRDFVNHPRLREERFDLRDVAFGHYPYLAQLAEAYFAQARGACSVYHLREILYKPKIPWWEWIQEAVDPWDPKVAQRGPREELVRDQYLAAAGIGPSLDAALKIGVGAAVIAAARVGKQTAPELERAFDEAFDHGMKLYAEQLKSARTAVTRLEHLAERSAGRATPR